MSELLEDKIAILGHVERQLATIETVDEAKDIRDKAEALRIYAKSAKAGLAIQNRAAAIKILAEQRAGTLLKATERASGRPGPGRGKAGRAARPAFSETPTLAELGVTKDQSSRWQAMTAIPAADVRELEVSETKAGRELTSKGIYQLARKVTASQTPKPHDTKARQRRRRSVGQTDYDLALNEGLAWAKRWRQVGPLADVFHLLHEHGQRKEHRDVS